MRGNWIKTIFKILAIIILFACIAVTNDKPRKATLLEGVVTDLISLPQKMYVYAREYVSSNEGFFIDVEEVKEENERLEKRIEELENKLINYEELYAENQVLKNHANLSKKYPDYKVAVADIISDSLTNWEKTYIVNKGENDGVTEGMTVLAEEGLIGYVKSVTKTTAKIVSILDAGNAVSARVTRTRDEVVCKGSITLEGKDELKIMNIPAGTVLMEGDKIETSGIGGIYPKGIIIGKVTEVINKKNPMESEAIIKSAVDFGKIETVAIILNSEGESNEQENPN